MSSPNHALIRVLESILRCYDGKRYYVTATYLRPVSGSKFVMNKAINCKGFGKCLGIDESINRNNG